MAKSNKGCHLNMYSSGKLGGKCLPGHPHWIYFPSNVKQNWSNKISITALSISFFFSFCLQGAMNEREANKGTIAAMVWLCVCVVPQQGRVRRDFWERRGGGRVLDPAKLTETVETNASVCVTASVVSAVWLQVTICMCVCVCVPSVVVWTPLWGSAIKSVCVHVCIPSCANTHPLCVFFLENKIKALLMHKIWARNAPYVRAEHKLFIMLVHCKRGHCAWIHSSYTTSLVPFQNGLVLTVFICLIRGTTRHNLTILLFPYLSLSLLSFLFRSHLSLASTPWRKLSGPPPLSHSVLFCPARSALQAGIHVAQWLGCHHSPLSGWSTMERGWAHLHRWVWVQQEKKMLFFLAFSWFLHNQESRQQLIHTWKNAAAVFVTFSNGTLS